MKALIITYYWPPAGGSGVQRWLKFVKYLRDFNIEPVVYTVKNPKYALNDDSLQNEIPEDIKILRQPIREPNSLLSMFKSKQQQTSAGFLNSEPTFLEKQLQYIRANFFIPDARKLWIKPSVKYLKSYLKVHPVDVIITTGPPHSLHLIGMQLKENLNIKWIADFRDPWTDIDYFHQLPLTEKSKLKHGILEKEVVQNADTVLVVGKTMKETYRKYNRNIHIITNGFDTDEKETGINLDEKFTLTHIGMMNADRNPGVLWEVLGELVVENTGFAQDLMIQFIGKVAPEVNKSLEKNHLIKNTRFIEYVPHQKVTEYQKSAQVLLLAVNNVPAAKGIITGKIFEYLQAKRPVLAIAPKDGDLAEIIHKTSSGNVVDFEDKKQLKEVIIGLYHRYKQHDLFVNSKNIEQYHRKKLTGELVRIIKTLQ